MQKTFQVAKGGVLAAAALLFATMAPGGAVAFDTPQALGLVATKAPMPLQCKGEFCPPF